MTAIRSVAILGGGIMGCSLAIEFSRLGVNSVIFEAEDHIFAGASRWNEGKIHLGYIYNADATLASARKVIPGGLLFQPLLEELIETKVKDVITTTNDIFLCHQRSVVTPDAMADYFRRVTELINGHRDRRNYAVDRRDIKVEQLRPDELGRITNSEAIVAGFRVPERSIATNWVADRFLEAVQANRWIKLRTGARVVAVVDKSPNLTHDLWQITTSDGTDGPFDCVVNALWHGRLAVDATLKLPMPHEWSHRYRLSVFLRTRKPVMAPSAVIATGAFGDIKNYNNRDFYMSWYPVGLRIESNMILPPDPPRLEASEAHEVADAVLKNLGMIFPCVGEISRQIEDIKVSGGWVYAAATGSLSDASATLHSRKDFGITQKGSYFSVDTGKYSTAPWLARRLVSELIGHS